VGNISNLIFWGHITKFDPKKFCSKNVKPNGKKNQTRIIYSDRETGNLRFDRFIPVYRISGETQNYFSVNPETFPLTYL
jgi:hypothetical protein